jgi:uncharacterized membrane protein YjgN (DUF898 family)
MASSLGMLLCQFILGFPVFLIIIQWMLIGQRFPWIGMLVNLTLILILVLAGFVISRSPRDCYPLASCSWDGLGFLVVGGYATVVLIISTGVGLIIKAEYRKRFWKPGEIIHQIGKIPSFLLMGVIIVLLGCYVYLLYTQMHLVPHPVNLPYKGYP